MEFDLEDLGWSAFFESYLSELVPANLDPARVIEEFKGFERVRAAGGEYLAEVTGRIRYEAEGREDFPAVGDWVGIAVRRDEGRARVACILPRRTKLCRKAAGRAVSEQILASNLDVVFVVAGLDEDFNLRRIERCLTMAWDSGARPVVLLNKADLCRNAEQRRAMVESITFGAPVHLLSAANGTGLDAVSGCLVRGQTGAFVGSSGVGKSSIIGRITGRSLRIQAVRDTDGRGRHTTTSRQMIFLAGGGIVIDTPGMRELQPWEGDEGFAQTFDDVLTLAENCRFRDCTHNGEPGCAVEQAVAEGALDRARLANHRKLQAELRYQERKLDLGAARQEKERWKKIQKAIRKMPAKGERA